MTPLTLIALADLQQLTADTIIDVRAPAEFAEDHLPGAINLPVLSDEERAKVGTLYTRVDRFEARKIGGALVARNTARHLDGPLAQKPGSWQPLVYCWRGGQRSGSFATILDQIGWRVQVLEGGYQTYRRAVVRELYEQRLPHRIVVIDGGTGTAKTALLHELAEQGAQTIDLEGMAEHRGSLFGALGEPQPAQKMFDSRIAQSLSRFDPDEVTFVEAESSKVGERPIPPSLWAAMGRAPRVRIEAPLEARARYLATAYSDVTQDRTRLGETIDKLRPYHSRDRIDSWHRQAREGDWAELASGLVVHHYDPRYAKSVVKASDTMTMTVLSEDALRATAETLIGRFSSN